MSATTEELQRRVESLEHEMRRLARLVEDWEVLGPPPTDGTLEAWLERLRQQKKRYHDPKELRRALGIPEDLEPIGAKAVREMMLAEGVRPEECLASSEIIRIRNETRGPEE